MKRRWGLLACLVGLWMVSPAWAITPLGDFPTGATVYCPWNTNGADGASITRSTNGTVLIYKNASATERTSAVGITDTEDFDLKTGIHLVSIDTSDNTDAGFYAAGNEYTVVISAATIDTKTVNAALCTFSIERVGLAKNVLVTATYAQPGQGTPAATTTLAQQIAYIYKFLRNRITQTATGFSVYNDDAVTVDQKATVSDNGTTFDRGEIATGP